MGIKKSIGHIIKGFLAPIEALWFMLRNRMLKAFLGPILLNIITLVWLLSFLVDFWSAVERNLANIEAAFKFLTRFILNAPALLLEALPFVELTIQSIHIYQIALPLINYLSGLFVIILFSPILYWVSNKSHNKSNPKQVRNLNNKQSAIQFCLATIINAIITISLLSILLIVVALDYPLLASTARLASLLIPIFSLTSLVIDFGIIPKENHYFKRLKFKWTNKLYCIGIGICFYFILTIPFLGLLLGGYVAILSVVGVSLTAKPKNFDEV